ncbi:MAG: FkbM family methyltransferase [Myxococcaceae bacterium]|nr:FkbM family methyltransferase [Myxococcaceae bacterium]
MASSQQPAASSRARDAAAVALGSIFLVVVSAVATTRVMKPAPPLSRDEAAQWYANVAMNDRDDLEFGEIHYSRGLEEPIIRDFFKDKRDGYFVDIGANHWRDDSNTYFLEKERGWSGLAVDALSEFAAGWVKNRPRSEFFVAFVSDVPDATETIFVPEKFLLVASSNEEFTKMHEAPGKPREVPTITLDQLLEKQKVDRVDLLNLDIELAEPKALAGFDIERWKPALVCVEAHQYVRQQVLNYMQEHHYVLVGKYLRVDGMNLYFMPEGTPGPHIPSPKALTGEAHSH